MTSSSSRRQRRRSTTPSSKDLVDEFEAGLSLYATLAWRFRRSAPFLPRTLRRSRPRPSPDAARAAPTVRYVAGHDGVKWWRKVSRLRCLWCARRFYRFADSHELIAHLRTCHGRFRYHVEDINDGSNKPREVTIYMKLLEGGGGSLGTGVDRFSEPDEESLHVNPEKDDSNRAGSAIPRPGTKRPSSSPFDDEPNPKRQRPSRSCATTTTSNSAVDVAQPCDGTKKASAHRVSTNNQPSNRKTKSTKSRNGSAKVEKGTPCYRSVAHAVREKRLWHSVLQNPLTLEEFEAEDDSDEEREEEHEWRLKLADDEVEEFEDTLAVEKLLMTLWNQFLVMEFHAYADHRVAPACKEFAKKYRRIIQNLNLEVAFLRHLTELGRIGLLDADNICEIGMILRNRSEEPTKEEEGARFLFAERIIRHADEEQKKSTATLRNGLVSSQ